ncbi:MAG TPA: hypothetical protein PKM88_15990 [bacterium]|nr:hypothetical protein [bacterium]
MGAHQVTAPPRAVTLLYDSDSRRQEELAAAAVAALRAQEADAEILRLHGHDEQQALTALLRECASDSLFGVRKLLLVTDAERLFTAKCGGGEWLQAYLSDPNPKVQIILRTDTAERDLPVALTRVLRGFAAVTAMVSCKPSVAGEKAAVRDFFRTAGLAIDDAAVERLAELRAADADGLGWCMEQLRDTAAGGRITVTAVEQALAGEGEGNLWGMLDALGTRRPAALAQLERLLRDEEPRSLLGLIRSRIRDLAAVRELQQAGRTEAGIAQLLGKKSSWQVQNKLAPQARGWTPAELRRALAQLGAVGDEMRDVPERLQGTVLIRAVARLLLRPAAAG